MSTKISWNQDPLSLWCLVLPTRPRHLEEAGRSSYSPMIHVSPWTKEKYTHRLALKSSSPKTLATQNVFSRLHLSSWHLVGLKQSGLTHFLRNVSDFRVDFSTGTAFGGLPCPLFPGASLRRAATPAMAFRAMCSQMRRDFARNWN